MMNNIFYLHHINQIGGVETYLYQIALKYGKTHDITIMYQTGDGEQIKRYSSLVRVIRWDGHTRYKCKKLFFGYMTSICDYVDAEEYYQVIHCDYQAQGLKKPTAPEGTRFLAVCESIIPRNHEWMGVDLEVAYNPIVIPKQRKILRLVSATRLTREKGKARMEQLCAAFRKADIPFTWTVFTDDLVKINDPSVVYATPRLDIIPFIESADYLVQLSDTEAYSYSILEALTVGTPVIITPLPLVTDMRIENGVNGWILPFEMDEIPTEKIYKGLPKFSYAPNEDPYGDLLAEGEPQYEKEKELVVTVRVLKTYLDLELDKTVYFGSTHETKLPRARMLASGGLVEILGDVK